MLKINLSDEQDDSRNENNAVPEETAAESSDAETISAAREEPQEETVEPVKPRGNRAPILVLVALIAAVVLVYTQKDTILGLFSTEEEPVEQVTSPPPPVAQPEPEPEPEEPDPTFVALNSISDAVPPRVWLSSMVIMYDGGYEIKGMAFSHNAILTLAGTLEKQGALTTRGIPKKAKSSETVYSFTLAGKLGSIAVPEILDAIGADRLVPLAESIKTKGKDYNVTFLRLPKPGQEYTEKDLPFSLEGSYGGLKQVVADLCPEGGDTKVYRIIVSPAAPGRVFDKVRASFSLRTVSAI